MFFDRVLGFLGNLLIVNKFECFEFICEFVSVILFFGCKFSVLVGVCNNVIVFKGFEVFCVVCCRWYVYVSVVVMELRLLFLLFCMMIYLFDLLVCQLIRKRCFVLWDYLLKCLMLVLWGCLLEDVVLGWGVMMSWLLMLLLRGLVVVKVSEVLMIYSCRKCMVREWFLCQRGFMCEQKQIGDE